MHRIWFNPQLIPPVDTQKYYVRLEGNVYFPHYCQYDGNSLRFLDLVTGAGYIIQSVLRVSDYP